MLPQVAAIVDALDADGNGMMSAEEVPSLRLALLTFTADCWITQVKVLLSHLTGRAVAEIPASHPEVVDLAGKSKVMADSTMPGMNPSPVDTLVMRMHR